MYDAWDCGDRPAIRAKLAKQEAIYRFAKQSGFIWPECFDEELEKFVALVEAAEREACAKVCETTEELRRLHAENGALLEQNTMLDAKLAEYERALVIAGKALRVQAADAIRARGQE
jgi:hypothetical protein